MCSTFFKMHPYLFLYIYTTRNRYIWKEKRKCFCSRKTGKQRKKESANNSWKKREKSPLPWPHPKSPDLGKVSVRPPDPWKTFWKFARLRGGRWGNFQEVSRNYPDLLDPNDQSQGNSKTFSKISQNAGQIAPSMIPPLLLVFPTTKWRFNPCPRQKSSRC